MMRFFYKNSHNVKKKKKDTLYKKTCVQLLNTLGSQ